ncbi:hypothetical protein MPSI1_001680 [Malassezia psittaci]|uniref:ADF-H domain-containing protein n=1 Tax=Malassezia psittaci TaxID=1821823 RepID=A0AAF0F9X4_9BASI|nr:hypothetical protein MPSI1_001680 [Malassezia psittaci]
MSATTTVDLDADLLKALRDFRLSKRSSKSAALVAKIDKKKLLLEEEEVFDPITPEELAEELPEHSPRFVIMSYELSHADGRVSYPLFLLYWAPVSASMELSTLYASALSNFSVHADVGKVIDIRDGILSKKVLDERLGSRR